MTTPNTPVYKAKDFQADDPGKPGKKVAIRWCPGCGDYAILAAVQQIFCPLAVEPLAVGPKSKPAVLTGRGVKTGCSCGVFGVAESFAHVVGAL